MNRPTNMHHATPEEFAAAGIPVAVEVDSSPRPNYVSIYWWRLRIGLPIRAPRFKVGDWAYNHHARENQKILNVWWDAPIGGTRGGWRVNFPGFGTFDNDVGPEREGTPRVEYVETQPGSHVWARKL
jgi:hypothetical protein